ncbi:MAG: hypothetical protein MJA83_16645 [Gammaproteobacteria bacterium]|nr:hypothetical protein [Gammaproteobacteria bacterium]
MLTTIVCPHGLRQQMREQHQREVKEAMKEATSSGQIFGLPKPMYQEIVPGNEVLTQEKPHYGGLTSPGTNDGHTHMAYVDGHGNGYTDEVNGHRHDVVSFLVADTQDEKGLSMHSHLGKVDVKELPTNYETPDYYGELHRGSSGSST